MTTTETPMLWVASAVATDGTYVVELTVGDDRAWVLTAQQATAHAAAFVAAATIAEHETALVQLLQARGGLDLPTIAQLVHDHVRPRRALDVAATAPLQLHPAAGQRGPFIALHLDGTELGHVQPEACRSHAAGVLAAVTAAAMDNAVHQVLTSVLELEDTTARAVIDDLPTYWPGAQTTP